MIYNTVLGSLDLLVNSKGNTGKEAIITFFSVMMSSLKDIGVSWRKITVGTTYLSHSCVRALLLLICLLNVLLPVKFTLDIQTGWQINSGTGTLPTSQQEKNFTSAKATFLYLHFAW